MPSKNKNNNDKSNSIKKPLIDGRYWDDSWAKNIQEATKAVEKHIKALERVKELKKSISKEQQADLEMSKKTYEEYTTNLKKWGDYQKKYLHSSEFKQGQAQSLRSNVSINNEGPKIRSLSDWYNARENERFNTKAQEIYDSVATKKWRSFSRKGGDYADSSQTNKVIEEINAEAGRQINEAAGQFGKHAGLFAVATRTFSEAVNIWGRIFSQGISNQTNTYEETITNIVARTGTSKGTYQSNQAGLNNTLRSMNLSNNIATSDVQKMWNSMADIGMNEQNMYETALDNVITKTILPYLDVTSQETQLLNTRIDGNFVKQIKGINASNLEIAGNNYITQDLLNSLIKQVQPMSDVAVQTLVQGSEEFSAYLNKLMAPVDEGGAGLSREQAMSIVSQLYKAQTQGYDMLANGSTSEKLFMTELMQKGINPGDLRNLNDMAGIWTGINQNWQNVGPGYQGEMTNWVVQGAINNSLGYDFNTAMIGQKMNEAGILPGTLLNTDLTEDEIKYYANMSQNALASDQLQSQKKLQDTTVENFMNELSIVNEWLGNWAGVLKTAITGLGTLLVTGVIGKGIGALAGLGGGTALSTTAGLGSFILGSAVKTFGPLAAIEAAVLIGKKVWANEADKIEQQRQQDTIGYARASEAAGYSRQKGADEANSKDGAEVYAKNKGVKYELFGNDGLQDDDLKLFGIKTRNAFQKEVDSVTHGFLNVLINEAFGTDLDMNYTDADYWYEKLFSYKNSKMYDEYNGMNFYGEMTGVGRTGDKSKEALMSEFVGLSIWALLHPDQAAQIQDLFTNSKLGADVGLLTQKDILAVVEEMGLTKDLINGNKFSYYTDTGEYINPTFTDEELAKFNLHRLGLNSVPYDNYPALLHEDEAVLTASTANELRALLEEYRNSESTYVNMQAVIESQTITLCNKFDEVISTIRGIEVPSTFNTNKISTLNNMLSFRSTKNFQ